MENDIRNTIERWKVKAEDFLDNNIRAFIVDTNDTYHFCYIIFVGDISVHVQHFKGNKKAEKEKLFWADIVKFEEYKAQEELKNEK